MHGLDQIVQAWSLWPGSADLTEPAVPSNLAAAEAALGRQLSEEARALYELGNGGSCLRGNLVIEPLGGHSPYGGVVGLTQSMHGADGLPHEAVAFGGDGSEALYAFWLSTTSRTPTAPVVETDIERGGTHLALIATNLVSFLRALTAFYLVYCEAPDPAMDALRLPDALRVGETEAGGSDLLFRLREWADPLLPDPTADCYDNPTDVTVLRRMYGSI